MVSADVQQLFRQHYLGLVRLAMRLVDDQESAEDLVQDVFAALPRRFPDSVDEPLGYLRAAVVNRSRSALRRRMVARAFWSRHQVEDTVEAAERSTMRSADRVEMLQAIGRLPRRQREVIVLRYYEDLPVGEIASVLKTSPGAVSSALNRALAALSSNKETAHVH
jgi:RNA polymerase sigma-70 factor (sigma-E family)